MEAELTESAVEPGKKNPELNNEEGEELLEKNTGDSSSASYVSSSSSSSLSLEFGVHENDLFGNSKFEGETLSGPDPGSLPSGTSDRTAPWSMLSTSPPPETGSHKSPVQTLSGPPDGYDPNRIPASIFASKATNPSDWSAASNESLFSIQMGNNSFSQDNAILLGKSGELGRISDWNGAQSGFGNVSEAKAKANESNGLFPVIEVSAHEESSGLASGDVSRDGSFDSLKVKTKSMEKHVKEKMAPNAGPEFKNTPHAETNNLVKSSSTPRTSTSNPRLSDESGNSGSSFAFPVLISDGVKMGSLKRITDTHREPQLQAQVSKATHKASERSWFSRLCCWRRCC
ncbi:hypothetical protein OROGR_007763 [Orobanche gracilis]